MVVSRGTVLHRGDNEVALTVTVHLPGRTLKGLTPEQVAALLAWAESLRKGLSEPQPKDTLPDFSKVA